MQNVIEVSNLRKKYKNFEAVKGISFSVRKGEIFGILGPNGAGKTTTLEIIEGAKKQDSGTCIVLGFDNTKDSLEIKKRIGVQLQASEYLEFLNLGELLILFGSLYNVKVDPIEILAKVGLEEKLYNQVKELSGGQKQRFTIATALVHKPQILFLDEPTTGLDPQVRRDMWELVKELNDEGMTVVLTTHYMEEAEYLCNRVAIMDAGQILKLDDPMKLTADLAQIYKMSFFVNKKVTPDIFQGLKFVDKFVIEHPKVVVELNDIASWNKVIKKLEESGVTCSYLSLKTATLEDVYLELTGKEYEE